MKKLNRPQFFLLALTILAIQVVLHFSLSFLSFLVQRASRGHKRGKDAKVNLHNFQYANERITLNLTRFLVLKHIIYNLNNGHFY